MTYVRNGKRRGQSTVTRKGNTAHRAVPTGRTRGGVGGRVFAPL